MGNSWIIRVQKKLSESVSNRHTNVAEAMIDNAITIAQVEGYHRSVVNANRQRHIFDSKTKTYRTHRTNKGTIVVAVLIMTNATADSAPQFPRSKVGCPVSPLLKVPIVESLEGKAIAQTDHACGQIEEVTLAKVVLIFEVNRVAAKVRTDGVTCCLRLSRSRSSEKQQE